MPRSQTLALSPSQQSPVRHSPQRPMPTRTRQQLNNVPGIINLPMSTKVHDSYPSSNASSQSPSRHSLTLVPQSLGSKPLASLDQALLGHQQDETKKRRRQKKTTPAVEPQEQKGGLSPNPISHSNSVLQVDENGVDQSTPTKATRGRRGRRGNRQTSPPLPEILAKESGFSSTTPPLADSHAHSQSVPPELPPPHHHHHHHYSQQSSEDEWDMPSMGGGGGGKRASGGAVKESLSWQQELLKTTTTSVVPRNTHHRNENKIFESPNSRPSPRQTRNSVPTPHRHVSKPRPVLHPSLSDTNASSSSNPSLNWQQEMLLQTDLQTSALSENRRTHSSSPTKPTPVTVTHTAPSSTMTPARQRQQRIKDSITFGLNDLDLSDEPHSAEDIFNSPISRHNSMNRRPQNQNQGTRRQSPPTNVEFATPTKMDSLEPRYAGPTFHNSPAPSSLPVPSFVLRRQT